MCFSFRTSIISYTLGMLSALFALITGQYMLGFLVLFYSQMQLAEAIIWSGIDHGDEGLNRMGTAYGKYLLPTHIIALGLGIVAGIMIKGQGLTGRDWIPLIVGFLFYGIVLIIYSQTNSTNTTYPANQCSVPKDCQNWGNRLSWPFPHSWYTYSFIISLIILAFWYNGPSQSKWFLVITFSLLFLGTGFIWPKSVGSAWCMSTALFAPIIVGVNWLLVR